MGHFRRNYRPVVNSVVARSRPQFVSAARHLSSFSKRPSAAVKRRRSSHSVRQSKRVRRLSKQSRKRSRGSSSSNGASRKRQKRLSSSSSRAPSRASSSRSSGYGDLVPRSERRSLARGSTVDRTSLRRESTLRTPGLRRQFPSFPEVPGLSRLNLAGGAGVVGPMAGLLGGALGSVLDAITSSKNRSNDTQLFNRSMNTGNYTSAVNGGEIGIAKKYRLGGRKRKWYNRTLRNFMRTAVTRTRQYEMGAFADFNDGSDFRGTTLTKPWAMWKYGFAHWNLNVLCRGGVYYNGASQGNLPGGFWTYVHKVIYKCFIINPFSVPYNYRIYYGIMHDVSTDAGVISKLMDICKYDQGNPVVWDFMQRVPFARQFYKSCKCLRYRLQPGERKDFRFGFRPGFIFEGTNDQLGDAGLASAEKSAFLLVIKWCDHLVGDRGSSSVPDLVLAQLSTPGLDVPIGGRMSIKQSIPKSLEYFLPIIQNTPPSLPFDNVVTISEPLSKIFVPNMVEAKSVTF